MAGAEKYCWKGVEILGSGADKYWAINHGAHNSALPHNQPVMSFSVNLPPHPLFHSGPHAKHPRTTIICFFIFTSTAIRSDWLGWGKLNAHTHAHAHTCTSITHARVNAPHKIEKGTQACAIVLIMIAIIVWNSHWDVHCLESYFILYLRKESNKCKIINENDTTAATVNQKRELLRKWWPILVKIVMELLHSE